ncbi:unnamed protein product [Rotaria magnacalcarata]|uniref:G/T mismatch-specific thymine DNA glycosylase n=1 Tax=Rotaria magnacalcarata TaxID=392030 RepID=A0A815YLS7_9BILA|nr:unnamed protein product [Rotaria magnacalcarata]CAF1572280.1 unnamed protein product [Rotaria magnacalcarata]CAF2099183.1 unnamed protein product [Rotaria magnacalcarata]
MNDELTTQATAAPIVLKIKTYDDIILPHTSRLSTDTLNDASQSSYIPISETSNITTVSPSILRVKLKKSYIDNDEDDEYITSNSSEIAARPAKRSKKSVVDEHPINNNLELNNDHESSQQEMNEIKQNHCIITEQSSNSSLILKIRRDSLASTISSRNTIEPESNQQLVVKFKQNEYGELTTSTNSNYISSNSMHNNNNEYTNGHNGSSHESLNSSLKQEEKSPIQPHITNMLSNLSDDNQWNNHQMNRNHIFPQTTTTSHLMDVNSTPAATTTTTATAAENHTKEMLDEALDSVKNVLMQTFKKNLEAGGDLSALKSTLGSDEVAEVFLSKLRESLKRETVSTVENEQKSQEHINTTNEIRSCQPTSLSTPINTIISPIMNVVSPSPSSPLPSISTIITKTTSPSPSMSSPSPQPSSTTTTSCNNNNKRKSSNPITNPNRFDGTTEEELSKRLLSDILQPNLDIVFVGINPSLYAVHKGHHYGGPGNHFWKLLHMSDLIPNAFTADNDFRMPQYGIGFTNIVQRPSKAGSDITKDEITAGAELLMQKIKMYRPKIVAFNGRGIYEVYAGNKHFHYGKQPELFLGTDTHVFVMPSSSARCSQLPRAEDKLPFYVGLRKLRDFLNGTLQSLNEADITFPDIKIKDTDDVLQKTIIRISNKAFSELSPETLKTYGDKIPSGQMTSKFNFDTETTQTMSILHNQQNGNLLNYDQQTSSTNGNASSKTSYIENTSSNAAISMNDTDQAVLAALANGAYGSSPTQPRQSQTVYVGRQQQSTSYSGSSLKNNTSTGIDSRLSTPSSSHTIHHLPQLSSNDHQYQSIASLNSQTISHQIVVINPKERLASNNPILTSSSLKDLLSSQTSLQKQNFIVPANPSSIQNSSPINNNQAKTSINTPKHTNNTNDDGLYLRYERESPSTQTSYHFSYVIDEYSSSAQKRLRYVSINDL